jgi:CubicO group peptidase (beta-lactamase class C family)
MKKLFFLLILPSFLTAQKNYPALLDQYMQAAVEMNQFNGSVLIAKGSNIIYEKTFGTLDYAAKLPLDRNSMFEIGMITEEFTAAAILLLRDEGKIRLSDPITKYFPKLPYQNVTIKHLLTHTSGLPDYYDDVMKNKWGAKKYATNTDVVNSLAAAKIPLAAQPGTRFDPRHYFTDYPVLAAIIERVTGKSYADYLQQKIFTPLRMTRTKVFMGVKLNETKIPNHTESIYFDESKQQFFPADSFQYFSKEFHHITKNIIGGKGISSTAHDLFLWCRALHNNKFLSASTQKEMFSAYVLKDTASKIYMGYGVLVGKNEFGDYVQQRETGNNETLGYLNARIYYAKADLTIINLAHKGKSTSAISGPLAYILFDREIVPPYMHQAVSIDTALLVNYEGTYSVPNITTVYKKEGTLWMTNPGEADLKLLPESNTKFFSSSKEYDWQIEFQTDENGKVLKTYFIFSGLKKEAKKL